MIDFTAEEKELLESFEKNEWKPIKGKTKKVSLYQQIAVSTFKKDSRVNIRMSSKDIHAIQVKALEEGIPYQTLISSILHKYVAGKLKEKEL
ncbi:MAG: antitoxin [Proteobacteria bacterium]|nr:antitoxin [Pseudomonadota bacterium]MBU1737758.1 antitoxin [Pseudomonadota bacterium]